MASAPGSRSNIATASSQKVTGLPPPSTPSSSTMTFRRKTERLDWRHVASIDVNQLIHSSTEEELQQTLIQQLLPKIAFCSIENEIIENDKADPGFIKVFQLAQLVIEYLLYQQRSSNESGQVVQKNYNDLGQEHQKLFQQVQSLKTALTDARKELKRRKEMLTSTQNEIIGPGNKDEYDQCPYCTKKFITSIYLLSHLHRRHQGLPLPTPFSNNNCNNGSLPNLFFSSVNALQQVQQSTTVPKVNSATNTTDLPGQRILFSNSDSALLGKPVVALEMVTISTQTASQEEDLISKTTVEEIFKPPERRLSEISASTVDTGNLALAYEEEFPLLKLRHDMDKQWNKLTDKIQMTGIEELKGVFMDEMQKIKEVINSSVADSKIQQDETTALAVTTSYSDKNIQAESPTPSPVASELEERFLKQEHELENLRNSMQSKIQEDMILFDGKLQAQELFWKTKLKQVEEHYEEQTAKLREQIQLISSQVQQRSMVTNSPVKSSHLRESLETEEPAAAITSTTSTERQMSDPAAEVTTTNNEIDQSIKAQSESLSQVSIVEQPSVTSLTATPAPPNKPVPKPRKTSTPLPVKVNDVHTANHLYEEPNLTHINEDQVSDYSTSDDQESLSSDEDEISQVGTDTKKKLQLKTTSSKTELEEKMIQMQRIREKVLQDVNRKMKELGIDTQHAVEDGAEDDEEDHLVLKNSDVTKALVELKKRRRSLESAIQEFPAERERIQTEVNFSATSKTIEEKLNENEQAGYSHFYKRNSLDVGSGSKFTAPESKANSPLVKMFSAVKSTGTSWKNKMVRSFRKKPASAKALAAKTDKIIEEVETDAKNKRKRQLKSGKTVPVINSNPSFFSRTKAKFSRNQNNNHNGHNSKRGEKSSKTSQSQVKKSKRRSKKHLVENQNEYISDTDFINYRQMPARLSASTLLTNKPKSRVTTTTTGPGQSPKHRIYGEEPGTTSDYSEGEEQPSETTRNSEVLQNLAKSLGARKNNPETRNDVFLVSTNEPTGQGTGQTSGHSSSESVSSGSIPGSVKKGPVRRNLIKEFEAVEKPVVTKDNIPSPQKKVVEFHVRGESMASDSESETSRTEASTSMYEDQSVRSQKHDEGHFVNLKSLSTSVQPAGTSSNGTKKDDPFLVVTSAGEEGAPKSSENVDEDDDDNELNTSDSESLSKSNQIGPNPDVQNDSLSSGAKEFEKLIDELKQSSKFKTKAQQNQYPQPAPRTTSTFITATGTLVNAAQSPGHNRNQSPNVSDLENDIDSILSNKELAIKRNPSAALKQPSSSAQAMKKGPSSSPVIIRNTDKSSFRNGSTLAETQSPGLSPILSNYNTNNRASAAFSSTTRRPSVQGGIHRNDDWAKRSGTGSNSNSPLHLSVGKTLSPGVTKWRPASSGRRAIYTSALTPTPSPKPGPSRAITTTTDPVISSLRTKLLSDQLNVPGTKKSAVDDVSLNNSWDSSED